MRNALILSLAALIAVACSGRSKRTQFVQDPETGGTLSAGGEDGNDAGRSSSTGATGATTGSGASSATGGSLGNGARAGSEGEGATAGTAEGARAGTTGKGGSDGDPDPGSGGTNTAGSGGSQVVTSCNDEFGFLGTWEGSLLDFFFEPIDSVRLEFDKNDDGTIRGRMIWGHDEPPPPPVDGDTPYPPGYWEESGNSGFYDGRTWAGFPYSIVRGAGCDNTLRFGIATAELWHEWCGMMEPVYTDADFGWGCTLQGGASISPTDCVAQTHDGRTASYPAWKCYACGFGTALCKCDENSCFASTEPNRTFDLALTVSEGKNVLTGPDSYCADCTIRLTRAE